MPTPPYHSLHDTSLHHPSTQLVRRDSGGKLPTSTIIGIAVACGCVAILALSLFLWRLILRLCRPNRSLPLPPVQPLAHQREQQLAAFADRNVVTPASWGEGSLRAPHYLHGTSSDSSLIPPGTPKGSLYTDDMATAESSSTLPSPFSNNDINLPPRLNLPGSPISRTHSESSSLRGVPTCDTFGTLPTAESVPYSEMSSLSAASSTHPLFPPPHSQTPSPSRSQRPKSSGRGWPSRPTSMVSYAGSNLSGHASIRTTNTVIRGAPHSIHSNVQIVLPTPLAPQLNPFGAPMESPNRSSVFVDRWISTGTPPLTDGEVSDGNAPRVPSSWNNQRRNQRRSLPPELPSSQSARSVPSSVASRRMTQQAPPVPRIPDAYYTFPFPHPQEKPEAEVELEMPERGRPRMSRPASLVLSEKNSDSSMRQGKPRTLRKPRPDVGS